MQTIKMGEYYWSPEHGDWLRDRFVCRLWLAHGPINKPFPPV